MKYELAWEDIILMEKAFEVMNNRRPKDEPPLEQKSFMAGWIIATNKELLKKEVKK